MSDIKTISMDSSELSWKDIEKDADKSSFKSVSSYVQYCIEYFHNRKILNRVTPLELYMVTTTTLLLVLVGVVVFR